MAPLCFGFGWVCSPLGGIGFRTQNGAKANAATAGSRGGKAIGNALRGTGREASKFAKRLDSGQKRKERQEKLGRGAHKMRKRRSREKAPLCFGFGYVFVVGGIGYGRLHGGKGAAKGRRSGTARDHKQSGKKIENQSAAHGNRTARKAKTKAGGKP